MFDNVFLTADHQAIAAFQTPNATTGTDIDVVELFGSEVFGAGDVVLVAGVATVDQDIAGGHAAGQILDHGIHHRRRHHHPYRSRRGEFGNEVIHVGSANSTFVCELFNNGCVLIEHNTLMSVFHQTTHHIGAHTAQTQHT